MGDNKQDPLIQSLMALAVSAAPLIQRARDAGIFKSGVREAATPDTVAEAVAASTAEPMDFRAEKAALQDIIVSQAMKIAALEAEVAKLTLAKPKRPGKT